jgi:hypothetical protein
MTVDRDDMDHISLDFARRRFAQLASGLQTPERAWDAVWHRIVAVVLVHGVERALDPATQAACYSQVTQDILSVL